MDKYPLSPFYTFLNICFVDILSLKYPEKY